MASLASDFSETFSHYTLKLRNGIQRNLTGSKISNVLYHVCVFLADRKNKMAALASEWLKLFSHPTLKQLIGIQQNLTGRKVSTSSTKFVFIGPIKKKTRWRPWPLIGLIIFDFSSETAERNSTKLDRKQDLNVLYHVCVFGPIGKTRWSPWHLIV